MNAKEVIPGFRVGDTVILEKETDITRENNIKPGTLGVVTEDDNSSTLEGWEVVDLSGKLKKTLDDMTPEKVHQLYDELIQIGLVDKKE
jgi:hypothetical protein